MEEIPFIEVGPHKSMEASASVLARPASGAAGLLVAFRPSPAETPAAPAALRAGSHRPSPAGPSRQRPVPRTARRGDAARGRRGGAGAAADARPCRAPTPLPVLLNLAVTAARKGGRRVIVVDADLKTAGIGRTAGPGRPARPVRRAGRRRDAGTGVAAHRPSQPRHPHGRRAGAGGAAAGRGDAGLAAATRPAVLRSGAGAGAALARAPPPWPPACDVVYLVLPEQEAAAAQVDELLQAIPRQGARLGGCILAAG